MLLAERSTLSHSTTRIQDLLPQLPALCVITADAPPMQRRPHRAAAPAPSAQLLPHAIYTRTCASLEPDAAR